MDPKEWQRLAHEVQTEAGQTLDELEQEFWPEPLDPSFRSFWPRIRTLNERLQTAPAIDIEAKLSLIGRIRQFTKRARQDQEIFFVEQRHRKQDTLDRIEEFRTRAMESGDPVTVGGVRQDLMAMRQPVTSMELPTRGERQQVWDAWQAAAQEVWDHLNEIWSLNEERLTQLLNRAQSHLDKGRVRETRDLVREFNVQSRKLEVSHKSARAARARANNLWREANEVAQAKHEAFLATAPEKVNRWREVKGRNAKAIARIRAEISDLERSGGDSGIAAALSKAMIEDKLRELDRLESTNDALDDRIENTEAALTTSS